MNMPAMKMPAMNMIAPLREVGDAAALQLRLTALNAARLEPTLPGPNWRANLVTDHAILAEEADFLEAARARVAGRAAAAPSEPAAFLAWFEALEQTGPGQGDKLFPWLAAKCSRDDLRWFLAQEVAGEAGFDDLTALTLPRMPVRAKLELARNFWDEMGRGDARGMHGPMLEALAKHLNLAASTGPVVWQAHALANTMAGLAANRRYAYQAIGALGIVELTAPGRATQVTAGLKRLGVPAKFAHYFALHAVLDVKHAAAWNAEVIVPLVESDARFATAIAEGALMRLECGAACFARYRSRLMTRNKAG